MSTDTTSAPVETATSADGTTIAYEAYGTGPAVVIVGGAFCDRGSFRELAQALAERSFTGVTYDRRGRGDSTDTKPYAVQREIEDLRAVLDAVAGAPDSGPASQAYLHGISSGGALVLEAIGAGLPIARASALEVPYHTESSPPAPPEYIETLERFEDAGDLEGIVRYFNTQVVGMPEEALAPMIGTPMWDALLALAPTVRYDGFCLGGDDQSLPVDRLAAVTTPFLAVASSGTQAPWLHDAPAALAHALPNGEHVELEGGFHEVPAQTLATVLADFYRG
ncbi:MAG: alpha/beta fold hydrolase [Intrasporangium sp.]|uniref:alpha/beta hydrolase n=1 Tax=Intrasporangium sp. TaxID=1925024 RepID=UPI003F7D805B